MIPTAEAVADYLRETRNVKVGVVDMVMFRPFPDELIGRIIKGRKGVTVLERLDQPLAVDLPLMREIRATIGKCVENGQDPDQPSYPGSRVLPQAVRCAAVVLGFVRHGQPRPAARGHRRHRGEHAARRQAQEAVLPLDRFPARQGGHTQAGDVPADDRRVLPARARSGPARFREPQPDAREQHHGALPLRRRLGRDHHGQEPGDDAVRPPRLPHQGQSQVRFGKEGPAHDLLPLGGARADPHQLRVLLRRRGPLARPQRVPPHQRAGRAEGRRRVHRPERQADAGQGLGGHPGAVPEDHHRQEDQGLLAGRVPDRPRRGDRPRSAAAHAGHRLPGRVLRRVSGDATGGARRGRLLTAIENQLQDKFGSKGKRVVEDNMRVVKRGFDEVVEVPAGPITEAQGPGSARRGPSRRSR